MKKNQYPDNMKASISLKINEDGEATLETEGEDLVLLAGSALIMWRTIRDIANCRTEAIALAEIAAERVMAELKKAPMSGNSKQGKQLTSAL